MSVFRYEVYLPDKSSVLFSGFIGSSRLILKVQLSSHAIKNLYSAVSGALKKPVKASKLFVKKLD